MPVLVNECACSNFEQKKKIKKTWDEIRPNRGPETGVIVLPHQFRGFNGLTVFFFFFLMGTKNSFFKSLTRPPNLEQTLNQVREGSQGLS